LSTLLRKEEQKLYSDVPPTKLRNKDEKFRAAKSSKFWRWVGDRFFYKMLENRFFSLKIKNIENYEKRDKNYASILYSPHNNWWDGIVGYNLCRRIFKTDIRMMIEEMNRFPILARAGAFPVNKKSAQAEKVTPEQAVFADKNKIETLNAVMKRINKLKFASKEFAVMRKAMYDLAAYHKDLSKQITEEGKKLTPQQLKDYGKRLEDLDKATKEYVMAKGLTPKTEKGRERLKGAMKIDHGIEDLIKGFEEVKKMDGVNLDDHEMNQENDHEMDHDASM
jgi:hypothetical protein